MKRLSHVLLAAGGIVVATLPGRAAAQDDAILIEPTLPPDFDRDRNVSVLQRPRPEYDALGIRVRSFIVSPRVDLGLGYNDNIFLTERNRTSDAYAIVRPSLRATSDWSRHQLSVTGSGAFNRYFSYANRNEDNWNVGTLGRLDVTSAAKITAEVQGGRRFETPFSSGAGAELATVSNYGYSLISLRGGYELDRNRFALAYNRNRFAFADVNLGDTGVFNQSRRDRTIDGVVGQVERAISPITSVYTQLSYAHTRYDERLLSPGVLNLDSDGYRLIAGINMDLPAFLRGTLAAGYTWRNYDRPGFRTVSGLSVDGRLEYFPTQLTTFTLRARRIIQDSSIGIDTAFFDTRLSLNVDHELLYNLILSAGGDLGRQDFIDSPNLIRLYRANGRARYLLSRQLWGNLAVSYSHRDSNVSGVTLLNNGKMSEFRLEGSLSFRL